MLSFRCLFVIQSLTQSLNSCCKTITIVILHNQKQMAVQITNITYKHYVWDDSLSELEVQLLSVKELLNLQQQKVSAKEAIRICEEYNQRCYMHFFFERPIEELVARVCQLNCVTLDCQELLGDNPKRLFLGKLGQGSMPCQSFSTLVA